MSSEAEFNRWSISVRDFEKAVAYADEAQKHSTATLTHEALALAAIVAYCRPFSQNEKDTNAQALSRIKIEHFTPISANERDSHEGWIALRNQALAHSEFSRNPTRLNPASGVISSQPFSLLLHAPDMAELAVLAQRLANECHHKRAICVGAMLLCVGHPRR